MHDEGYDLQQRSICAGKSSFSTKCSLSKASGVEVISLTWERCFCCNISYLILIARCVMFTDAYESTF